MADNNVILCAALNSVFHLFFTIPVFAASQQRLSQAECLKNQDFDLLVVGGGATGAGVFLEAASRGAKTALIERGDFASETSSQSTKLIHGGVRYLEKAIKNLDYRQYKLVREGLEERKHFLNMAPHLAHPIAIITPVYNWLDRFYLHIGLKIYDFISGEHHLGDSVWLTKDSLKEKLPGLKQKDLIGGIEYWDGQFDDARMVLSLFLTGLQKGGCGLNYVEMKELIKDENGKIIGVQAYDHVSKSHFPIKSKHTVNATGVHSDQIRLLNYKRAHKRNVCSQGVHITLDAKQLPLKEGLLIPNTSDGRVLFAIPWQGEVIAGTTDTHCDPNQDPIADETDIDYIAKELTNYFPALEAKKAIKATWAGYRPLVAEKNSGSTQELVREHVIMHAKNGLTTITGGKWTSFRRMAEDTIDSIHNQGFLNISLPSVSKNLKIVGSQNLASISEQKLIEKWNLQPDMAKHLLRSYGDQAEIVLLCNPDSAKSIKRLFSDKPFALAEVEHSRRNEFAVTNEDIFKRRMRLSYLDHEAYQKGLQTF